MASATTATPASRKPRRDGLELLTGFVVIAALVALAVSVLTGTGRKAEDGYRLSARFSHVDGLSLGSPVRLAGVDVGQVVAERVDPRSFQAEIAFSVRPEVKLPEDTAAIITSDSLLGGKYIALEPGGADKTLPPGGRVTLTQGSISLEQLLSKFIFSVTDAMSAKNKTGSAAGTSPAAAGQGVATPSAPPAGDQDRP
ncbi:outer membrane lipid asymmetry maintenance protein MlaD [Rhizosaccharibacter radicis]|uniref:Outer membrane lipid asymmetry maintenance protein MlaD n=1 Tax=Rhizosaccharibacter radicis TaxID=2782605 RepID=A0ABT1W0L5_9PROT|nr:outer membrane lipid asymmetry maintenance protein MlaD [Acetobacteraceae bacterium KSS12]